MIGHSGLSEWRNEVDVVTGVKLTFFNWLSNGRRQKAGGWLVGQPIIDCASHCGGSCDTCHAISSGPGAQSKYCAPLLFPQPSFFSLAHHPSIHHPALSPAHPPSSLSSTESTTFILETVLACCISRICRQQRTTILFHSIPFKLFLQPSAVADPSNHH